MSKDRLSIPQPNEQLKQARLLRNWTQTDVAGYIGTDGYTVNRWERGRARPGPYFRQLLCELFGKSALDLGLVPAIQKRATPVVLSSASSESASYWHVPYQRNPFFTGRDALLERLHSCLNAEQSEALTQLYVLHGLGGIGKTQVATEYAYRYAPEYASIFWIEAENADHIRSSILRIAMLLQLPEQQEADEQRIMVAVQRWLATHGKWLLIWDNLEDLTLLQGLLPPTRQGSILITTRCQALGMLAHRVDLAPLEHEEGMLFVLRRARVLEQEAAREQMQQLAVRMPTEYIAASKLVTAMGGLPLALDQAGAYIDETRCSVSDYWLCYEQQRPHLLNRRGTPGENHPLSVTATFLLASKRAEREQRVATDILRMCALLDAEAIPEELFRSGAPHLGPMFELVATDPTQFDLAIAALRNESLLQRHAQTRTLSLHCLVQAVLQEEMSGQERLGWLIRLIAVLNAVFPEDIAENWRRGESLLPHILIVAAAIPEEAEGAELAIVLRKAADYLCERARYEQAELLYQRALRIGKRVLGSEHPDLARMLNGLALLSYEQGKYELAGISLE